MSLLRDGIHRRAPLTARFGSARFGAARFGCVYGQDDLATLTREIKDENLEGAGPFYVWSEALPIESPFAGPTQYISSTGVCALTLGVSSTVNYAYSVNMILGVDSTDYFNPAMLVNMILGCESEDTFISGSDMGSPSREQDPNPFSPSRQRLLRGH